MPFFSDLYLQFVLSCIRTAIASSLLVPKCHPSAADAANKSRLDDCNHRKDNAHNHNKTHENPCAGEECSHLFIHLFYNATNKPTAYSH